MTSHPDFPERPQPFARWMAQSRLLDAAGTPLALYPRAAVPATDAPGPLRFGFEPAGADSEASAGGAPAPAPVYLAMRNPHVIWESLHTHGLAQPGYLDGLRRKGFDSIIVLDDAGDAIDPNMQALRETAVDLIVFEPEQVRTVAEVEAQARAAHAATLAAWRRPAAVTHAAFAAFMAGSRVVHADGSPLVTYHGTADTFDQFDADHAGKTFKIDKHGFFFAENPTEGMDADNAAHVAAFNRGDEGTGQNLRPVFLAIKNPLVIEAADIQWPYEGTVRIGGTRLFDSKERAALFEQASKGGHDGLYFPFEEHGVLQGLWVALRPEQILSVFDPIAIGQHIAYTPASRQPRPTAEASAPEIDL